MATIIEGKSSIRRMFKELEDAMKRSAKGMDTKKHCGVIKLRRDPVKIQKGMRDEWE